MCTNASVHRGSRCQLPQELGLQAVVSHLMWVLGIELRFSGSIGSALNHGATSPAPKAVLLPGCHT